MLGYAVLVLIIVRVDRCYSGRFLALVSFLEEVAEADRWSVRAELLTVSGILRSKAELLVRVMLVEGARP